MATSPAHAPPHADATVPADAPRPARSSVRDALLLESGVPPGRTCGWRGVPLQTGSSRTTHHRSADAAATSTR